MTDRLHSIQVIFDKDIRTDDVEPIIQAIGMIRGVRAVKPMVADVATQMAEARARFALSERLWNALKEDTHDPR